VHQPTAHVDSTPGDTREVNADPPATPPVAVDDPSGETSDVPNEPRAPLAASPPHRVVTRVAVPQATGPYRVRVVDENHQTLPTFADRGKTYVMGTVGSRYSVVVSNPTAKRVEAVISVDGVDAIDGHPADYVRKRGYILPAYGDMTVDGFRTSMDEVATFRFSSVADSYAGRLGQPRDVGVIGVAFFSERAPAYEPPPSIATEDHAPLGRPAPRRMHAQSAPAEKSEATPVPSPAAAPAPPAPPAPRSVLAQGGGGAPVTRQKARAAAPSDSLEDSRSVDRPGLGTEFGEARASHIGTTDFTRATPTAPRQVVALRYNDRAGLLALGIPVTPSRAEVDVHLRETADPFRENRFAQAPP